MSLSINTAKIAGNPDANGCSQSYDIRSEDPAKNNTHGELHLSVSIKDISDNSQSIFIIRGVVAQIQKKFYDNKEDSVVVALSKAISSTVETYQKEIEIASAVILKNIAYIVTYGTAEVLLRRDGKLAVFRSPNGAVFKSSGELRSGDLLVLATKSFVNETPKGVLNAALEKKQPQQIVEFLAPTLQSKDNNSTICASFIAIDGTVQPKPSSAPAEYPKINTPAVSEEARQEEVVESRPLPDDKKQEDRSLKQGLLSKLRSRKFYIKDFQDEKEDKRRRLLSFAGLALLIVLSGTVAFGLYKKKENERQERVQELAQNIEKDLTEAEEIFSYSPQRSQELVQRSKEELKKLEDPELNAEETVALLREKIDKTEGSVLGLHTAEANDFLDLDLLSSGFSGDKLSVYNGVIYILDSSSERLIRVGVSNKRSEVVAGKDKLEDVKDVAVWSSDIFVLRGDGVYDIENNKILDSNWSGDTLIKSYAGNIYLLDKGNSEILRYSIDDGSLSSRTSWLSDEVSADFSKIVSWGIDGAIWLSSESGSVFKYTYGYQQNFTLGKVAPELTSGATIYVSNENEYVYLLDGSNARILVFDKDGVYEEQYNQEMIKDAKDIAVFEDEGKIILLTGDRLKYIDIE